MSEPVIHSHWHQSIAGLTIVPSEFYEAVAQAIARRNIPGVTITGTYFSEGAIGSAQRLYLRAKRFEYFFDICGAPFADGSFVSWWLVEDTGCMRGCLLGIPVLGWLLVVLFFRETYYKVDTRLMFQDAILAGTRKYRLGLTAAHQSLRPVFEADQAVASALLANAATRIVFRVGEDDAKKLADGFASFDAQALTSLGVGEAICRIDRADHDFNLKVRLRPRAGSDAAERRERIIARSRERYGTAAGERRTAPNATVPQPAKQNPHAAPEQHSPKRPTRLKDLLEKMDGGPQE